MELLDRTGIVAASLPRRRRTDAEAILVDAPIYTRTPVCDQDLRPKSVVIRRRARTWLGGGAAVLLVAAGWLGGGLFTGGLFASEPERDVAQLDARPAVAAAPAPATQPQPQPPAPQAPAVVTPAPKTVYVPVPAKPAPKSDQVQAQAKPQQKKDSPEEEARVDLPSASTPPSSANPIQSWVEVAESVMQRYGR
ncbi:hypothetical protein Q5425_08870 [Amycolatopsis sp. A133]|uniref:hypothetical protein n=1 Tax=Amycolatopsis sp. A133 TaxID=3064472 RepID=UPI0027E97908|nr:hypothetical protein [Amycolatopsis sp. A133]MDQ7803844.1 hypothetical protein [Amycolatopsis sp. A133]